MSTITIIFAVLVIIILAMLLSKKHYLAMAVVVALVVLGIGLVNSKASDDAKPTIHKTYTVETCGRWC